MKKESAHEGAAGPSRTNGTCHTVSFRADGEDTRMNTNKLTLPLEHWLLMSQVLDRLLAAPYSGKESVATAIRLIRIQRVIERAKDDSGLEPVTTKAAREYGEMDEKAQRYVFTDRDKHAAYVQARRAVLEQDATLEVPVLSDSELPLSLSAAERAVISPLVV